ncbi:hypothetical protein ACVNHC_00575 [Pannonibacter sp. Q-1]|uniref:Uncharacterized protein n=1 Tax=Pannonibacter phragmitetus TaxID=121719 RepID=A0A0L0J600_9HYPH|nr:MULTISPECIES: hypothetical protein [Pannonibacter]ALV29701.1 hypothetical protein APZ00_23840 [Pannonibacter phragmitetus]KND21086.1 hypothetical protein ADZ37_00860 [Pannonibacter phragmitetus]MBA4203511.1 K(+)-transporting ATPase subunit F [Polymorphum sp.]
MPSFDGGHYFLTVLVPVRTDLLPQTKVTDELLERDDNTPVSYADQLRSTLSTLPVALQSPATIHTGIQSFFARNLRTHLTRFVVIETPMYNGRNPQDSIYASIAATDLTQPQPQDQLSCPFLLWAVDFDPVDPKAPPSEEPAAYLRELWAQMQPMLHDVFINCYGFADRVKDADSFARYILDCQVETTMPFNDYWITPPPLPSLGGFFSFYAFPAILAGAAFVLGLIGWLISGLFGVDPFLWMAASTWGWITCGGFISLLLLAVFAYVLVLRRGAVPFPPAPNSDLRSVLKAIYLQRHFTRFMIANQGLDDETLYRNFGEFITQHQPANVSAPTQPPGVIG